MPGRKWANALHQARPLPPNVFECRLVTHVAYRVLPFYSKDKSKNTAAKTDIDKDWCVYRFICRIDTDKSDELAGYLSEAAFFAVCGPRDTSTPRWTLLDWTSAPLRRLNEIAQLDLAPEQPRAEPTGVELNSSTAPSSERTIPAPPPTRQLAKEPGEDLAQVKSSLSHEKLIDYLLFFVSYLGSSEERDGLIHPFLIPESDDEIFKPVGKSNKWAPSAKDGTSSALPDFEEVVASKPERMMLFKEKDFSQAVDPVDEPYTSQPLRPMEALPVRPSPNGVRNIVANFFEEESKDEKQGKKKRAKWFNEESIENSEKPAFLIAAPMTYRGALFEVTFSLDSDGTVLMIKDRPEPGAEWLPAPRWEVRRRPDGIHLLCLQASRRLLTLEEIQGDLENENQSAPDRITKHRRRIEERFDWSRTIKRSLVFKDVEFMEEVVLDDSLFERSLEFHECRFLRGLSLRNASVNGSLILDRSEVEGALPERSQPPVKHSLVVISKPCEA